MQTIRAGARFDLTNAQWTVLEPLLPVGAGPGRPPAHPRRHLVVGGHWRVRVDAPWRDVPERYGPWQSVYTFFRRWQLAGVWAKPRADGAGAHRRTARRWPAVHSDP
ncbi:transposase [Streptomyces inhibens]|uniref:transposase n=1 Tax=Streptomyces inhibens TaxID=2293571 RepID=UPI00402AC9C5